MEILYPANPGSIYHMTKSQDALFFWYYNRNFGTRITDLHQGIVWGTQTPQTRLDERLINRFDYDGDYGTVLNRFLMQAAIGYRLSVHGTGGQTRAFIHIQDTVRCIELALANPPAPGTRVAIMNQMTETHRLIDLAKMISTMTGVGYELVDNPRNEAAENQLVVCNDSFRKLGLRPTELQQGLMNEGDRDRPAATPTAATAPRSPACPSGSRRWSPSRSPRPRWPRLGLGRTSPSHPARRQRRRSCHSRQSRLKKEGAVAYAAGLDPGRSVSAGVIGSTGRVMKLSCAPPSKMCCTAGR